MKSDEESFFISACATWGEGLACGEADELLADGEGSAAFCINFCAFCLASANICSASSLAFCTREIAKASKKTKTFNYTRLQIIYTKQNLAGSLGGFL